MKKLKGKIITHHGSGEKYFVYGVNEKSKVLHVIDSNMKKYNISFKYIEKGTYRLK